MVPFTSKEQARFCIGNFVRYFGYWPDFFSGECQGVGFVVPFSISQVFADNQKEYYAQLNAASRTLDVGEWLKYFIESVITAVTNANEQISFLLAKTVFFDRFENQLNDRQGKLIRRLFDAGPEGFQGGLSARNYERLTRSSKATATRELTELRLEDLVS